MNVYKKSTPVIIAGAGPGDPDLISLKALKYLQKADVILTDRLVAPSLIAEHARKDAEVIYVGKQCSRGIHTPQQHINSLMVKHARQNKMVLRLKGGDASLFSNILDELQVLKTHGIAYEIIPGISAAFGASAYTGIPLTARGCSRGVRFLTLFDIESVTCDEWKEWAKTTDTLVFYMSGQRLKELAAYLIRYGIAQEKGIAVIQQATTPSQTTRVFSFKDVTQDKLPEFGYVPTLLMVGNVVNLHPTYSWFKEQKGTDSYFDHHINQLQYVI